MVSDFHGPSSHSFRSVSTEFCPRLCKKVLTLYPGFASSSKLRGLILSLARQSKCFTSYLPAIEYELNKLCAKMSCLTFD